jgi:hypothetical protein
MGWSRDRFQHEIGKFDRLLRVRLNWTGKWWLIERKCQHGSLCLIRPCDLDKFPDRYDEYVRDKDGYTFVFKVRRDLLGPLAIAQLREADMWAFGGAERFADHLDELDRQAESQLEEEQSAYLQARSEEIYDEQMIRQGDVVSNFHEKVS